MIGARKVDVVIIGGGLAGLATSLAFARDGIETVVVESGRAPGRDVFGFVLWPPASRCLRWLDVLDDVLAQGTQLRGIRWSVDGKSAAGDGAGVTVDTSRLGAGTFLGILPSRLVATLRAAAPAAGAEVVTGAGAWSVERAGDRWSVEVERAEGGEPLRLTTPLLVGADGSNSALRERLGFAADRWRPKGQVIVTGVGGDLPVRESRQVLVPEGSWGAASLGPGLSWLYAVVRDDDAQDPRSRLERYAELDPEGAPAVAGLVDVAAVRPWSIRVPRWATDGALLMGDAAHGMLPHFGLGGSLTLEDVPLLTEVVQDALRTGDTSAARLDAFQRRRAGRIAYGQRTSNRWAQLLGSRLPGVRVARDLSMRRLARKPQIVEKFYQELASPAVPSLPTRLRMLLP